MKRKDLIRAIEEIGCGARLLCFFEINVDPEKGFKVAMVGFVMLLAGIGLLFLEV